jgi:N-methylhydantoinase A
VVARRDHGLTFHKEASVPSDPSASVARGLAHLIETGVIAPERVELIVHGTTIGLNAIIQRRGARMAMVVSEGTRDVLEIARLRLPSSYDVTVPRERPLVPRRLMFEVAARIRADGTIERRPAEAELEALAARIRAAKVQAVAVMLLNAYRHPALEAEVAQALAARLPGIGVTASAAIWPEVREYERALVAGLNASIQPLMTSYFDRLQARAACLGIGAPIYITANNGGTLSLSTARARPIDTVLSGPASGVVAATRIGAAAGMEKLVTVDMGGTSADISIVRAGVPEFTTSTFVGDFPLMMPVVNVAAIGAGGGSVLWVDAQGLLKVGPHSAGADPGPACYGRGGTEATVTDCYVALGVIAPERFLGGRMALDRDAAVAALGRLGACLDMDAPAVAEAALRVASAKMATELTRLMAVAGVDPRHHALVAFGGAGPTHAGLLAEAAGLDRVLVPLAPGTFCALGAILADVRRDFVRTVRRMVASADPAPDDGWPAIAAAIAELQAEALAWIADEGELVGAHDLIVTMRVRYPDQADELEVIVPESARPTLNGPALAALFHAQHATMYGFADARSPVQVTAVRLGILGRVPPVRLPHSAPAADAAPRGTRTLRLNGGDITANLYARADLGHGARLSGPAIIEQADTTVLVPPGWQVAADAIGTLHLTRNGSDA